MYITVARLKFYLRFNLIAQLCLTVNTEFYIDFNHFVTPGPTYKLKYNPRYSYS